MFVFLGSIVRIGDNQSGVIFFNNKAVFIF